MGHEVLTVDKRSVRTSQERTAGDVYGRCYESCIEKLGRELG